MSGGFKALTFGTTNAGMSSADGDSWANFNLPTADCTWESLIYVEAWGLWVAGGYDTTTSRGKIMTSATGASGSWTQRTMPTTDVGTRKAFAFDGTTLVSVGDAVGVNDTIITSTDGITWTLRTSPVLFAFRSVAWSAAAGLFIAGHSGINYISSPTGTTWTARTSLPASRSWRDFTTAGNGHFVAIAMKSGGNLGDAVTSADGLTWNASSGEGDKAWQRVVKVDNDRLVAVASDGTNPNVMVSDDHGATWTSVNGVAQALGNDLVLAWDGTAIVALGSSGGGDYGMRSLDNGDTWSAITPLSSGSNGWTALGAHTIPPVPPSEFWTDFEGATEDIEDDNRLTKDTQITYDPGSPGYPGTPGTPARPAYYAWEDVVECGIFVDGGTYEWVYPDDGGPPEYRLVPGEGSDFATSGYRCITSRKLVFHPATPEVPAVPPVEPRPENTTYNFNLGWNAGARSVNRLDADGYASFTMNRVVGVVCGLNSHSNTHGYLEIDHGFMLAHGIARVMERGVTKFYHGAYADGTEFKVQRTGTVVKYYVAGSLVYTSDLPSEGPVYLDASMYSGGDEILTPEFGLLSGAELTLPAMKAASGLQGAALTLPMLTVSDGRYNGGAGLTLPGLRAFSGNRPQSGQALLTLPLPTMYSEGGYELPPYALAAVAIPKVQAVGYGLTGEIGGATLTLPAIRMLAVGRTNITPPTPRSYGMASLTLPGLQVFTAGTEGSGLSGALLTLPAIAAMASGHAGDEDDPPYTYGQAALTLPAPRVYTAGSNAEESGLSGAMLMLPALAMAASGQVGLTPRVYGEGRITLPGMVMSSNNYEGPLMASMGSFVQVRDTITAQHIMLATMTSTVDGQSTMQLVAVLEASMTSTARIDTNMLARMLLEAAMNSTIIARFGELDATAAFQVWSVDMENAGSTLYEQFEFESMGRIGNRHYGVRADGVYLLEGDDDDGEPIAQMVDFGSHDFGTSTKKGIPHVYAATTTEGELVLRVSADRGQTYDYYTRVRSEGMHRFDPGKGLSGTYLNFQLRNVDGNDLDISKLEFHPIALKRRV